MPATPEPKDRRPDEAGREPASGPEPCEDNFEDIDWAGLQTFFLDHLREQFGKMAEAAATGDLNTLSRVGHGLKGSGGGVQLPRFSEFGRNLEVAGNAGDFDGVLRACRAIRDEYVSLRPLEDPTFRNLFAEPRSRAA